MSGKRNDSMRLWASVSIPIVALVLVVAAGVLGRFSGPSPSTARSVASVPSEAAPASSSRTSAPTPPPTPSASPVVGAVCLPNSIRFDPTATIDLTGAWAGDDGGIYYVRQLGSVIWWSGMSERDQPPASLGRDWNNVGRGELGKDLTIVSDWADVPRGGILGSGTVTLKVGPDADGNLQITKRSETGTGRGDTLWTPCVRA